MQPCLLISHVNKLHRLTTKDTAITAVKIGRKQRNISAMWLLQTYSLGKIIEGFRLQIACQHNNMTQQLKSAGNFGLCLMK